jgi:hypothetical protein
MGESSAESLDATVAARMTKKAKAARVANTTASSDPPRECRCPGSSGSILDALESGRTGSALEVSEALSLPGIAA